MEAESQTELFEHNTRNHVGGKTNARNISQLNEFCMNQWQTFLQVMSETDRQYVRLRKVVSAKGGDTVSEASGVHIMFFQSSSSPVLCSL